jgi:transcriptional regulator with XRE-family HTH domain
MSRASCPCTRAGRPCHAIHGQGCPCHCSAKAGAFAYEYLTESRWFSRDCKPVYHAGLPQGLAMRRRQATTIRDVARAARLSPAAISRYFNGDIVLPPESASRIERAVRDLRYQPNLLARNLSLGQSKMVGLVIPDISNPFFAGWPARSRKRRSGGTVFCFATRRTIGTESWPTSSSRQTSNAKRETRNAKRRTRYRSTIAIISGV